MAARHITTPFVTPERAADVLGVSKTRASKLIRWAHIATSEKVVERVSTRLVKANGKNTFRKSVGK